MLTEVMPEYDVRKRHAIALEALPGNVWRAVHATTLAETPVARILFRLRGLPAAPDRGLLELEGFRLLAEDPGRELVVGAVGKPWSPRGGLVRDADPRTFRDAGYVVMALSVKHDGATLATETRVRCTDSRSRVLFRLYWLVVGPFSGLVRNDWLRAIRRRAHSTV
jgi:hypothetical protein